MEPNLDDFCQAVQHRHWEQAWNIACTLPRTAFNNPPANYPFDQLARQFVQQLLAPHRRLLERLAQQLPTTDGLEFLTDCYAHPSLKQTPCFCPLCNGKTGEHPRQLFRFACAAAQIAHALRAHPHAAAPLFQNALQSLCQLTLDATALSAVVEAFPTAWFRDAARGTDVLTRQRVAMLADLTHWFATGAWLTCPYPRRESRAALPLIRQQAGAVPAQFRVAAALNDFPAVLYPSPLLLLNTVYDERFAQQLAWSWEAAQALAESAPECAVRWQLTAFREPSQWSGGAVSEDSGGGAMVCALVSLFRHDAPPVDDDLFLSLSLRQSGNGSYTLVRVGGVASKCHLLTLEGCRGCRMAFHQDNQGDVPPEFPLRDALVFLDSRVRGLWDASTGLTRALQSYLNKTAKDLNPILWANLTLEQVFVEPRLQIRKPAPQRRPNAQPPTERSEDAREAFPTRDNWEEDQARLYELLPLGSEYITETVRWKPFTTAVLSANARQALVGAPGSGKTTATKALARQLAQEALQQMAQGADLRTLRLPLWVRLSEVKLNADAPLDALLTAAGVPDGLRAFYREMLQSGRVVVFLDGLDELDETREIEFKRWLQALLEAMGATPVLLTCRTLPWEQGGRNEWAEALKAKEPYELASLNAREQEAFIRKFFADDPAAATRLRELMQRNFALRHTARTYLLATIIALLHRQHQIRETTTYAELYELFWLETLQGRWKEVAFDWSVLPLGTNPETIIGAALRRVLTPIGFYLFQRGGNRNDFHQADWERAFETAQAQDSFLQRMSAIDFSVAMRLYDLLAQVGLISVQGQRFFFNHRSFLEYLAGAYLARLPREQWEPILRGAGDAELVDKGDWGSVHRAPQGSWWWFAPEYAETIAFMASAMEDATPLLEAIEAEEAKYPREVFRHLLVHKARVAGYGKVKEEKRTAIVQEVLRLYLKDKHPPRAYVLPALHGLGGYAIPALIQRLQDGNEWVRREAAEALGLLGDARAVDALIDRLQNEDWWVRREAAWALGRIGDARAVDALIDRLQDEDWWVRRAAAEALGRIGDARAVDALIDRLQDEDWGVRRAAAWALELLGDARAVDALIDRLQVGNEWVRRAAAWVLGRIGDARAVDALIDRLQDEDSDVRRAAAEALEQIGDARAVDALIDHLQDEASGVREVAAEALGRIGDARAVDALIDRLQDEDWWVRRAAARALGLLRDARAVDALIDRLQDEDWWVRRAAARALGLLRDARAVDALIDRLQDKDPTMRKAAAWALGDIGDARAVDALIDRLQDEASGVREVAAEALGRIGDARAVDALIDRLQDEDWGVRGVAAEALGDIGDARAVDALIDRLQDGNEWVRYRAARALGQIGDARAVDALIDRLQDKNPTMRYSAAKALGQIGDARAIPRLIPLLQVGWISSDVYEVLHPLCRPHRLIAQYPEQTTAANGD